MYYGEIKKCDIANGPGVRVSLFVSGCTHHCKGCFNEETWSFEFGQPFTAETEEQILKLLEPSYISGLTVLGGEPMEYMNQEALLPFLEKVKERFPEVSLIFITPPDAKVLRERLEGRGTETQDVIEKRLARAAQECAYMDQYDYIVINDDLNVCVEQIHGLIQALHWKCVNQQGQIAKMKGEFANKA